MYWFYDVESFPNLFSVTLIDENDTIKQLCISEHKDKDKQVSNCTLKDVESIFLNNDNYLFGFNNMSYDDKVMNFTFNLMNELIQNKIKMSSLEFAIKVYKYSQKLILMKDQYTYTVKEINPFMARSIDLKAVNRINKSLKMCAVNLKHDKIQDLPYGFNDLIQEHQVEKVMLYNINDVVITKKLYLHTKNEIDLRFKMSEKYKINLLNADRPKVADELMANFYSSFSGTYKSKFVKLRTERHTVEFKDVITSKIRFKTPNLQKFYDKLKQIKINPDAKFEETVLVGNTRYLIAKGGIHSINKDEVWKNTVDYLIDCDATSYYPKLMINYKIKPSHLSPKFIDTLAYITDTRIKAKESGDTIVAEAMKIVINSVFGKLNNEHSWWSDPLAFYRVTINGQLLLLMLIEALELEGITVFYANTDGITASVPPNLLEKYNQITSAWSKYTEVNLEFERFKECYIKNVNSYCIIKESGKVKTKNDFDSSIYKDLNKAFDAPIIAHTMVKHLETGNDIMDILISHSDILDFCYSQKVGSSFGVYFGRIEGITYVEDIMQASNRYLVCHTSEGGALFKKDGKKKINLISGENVFVLNDYTNQSINIKYEYYYKKVKSILHPFLNTQQSLF